MPDNNKKTKLDPNKATLHKDFNSKDNLGTLDSFGQTGIINTSFGNTNFGEFQFDTKNTFSEDITNPVKLEQLRGEKQGWASEAVNAIGGGLAKMPFTIIGNTASMLDFEDYFNQDNEIGNAVTTWAEEVKGNIEGATKIYKSNDNSLSSREWWMNNAKGLFDSAGAFALTGAGLGKGVQLLSQLTKSAKIGNIITKLGNINNTAMLNQAESIPIAMDVYKSSYYITLNKLEQSNPQMSNEELDNEARKQASDAASYSIAINRINIPLNLTSVGAFLRPVAMTRQVATNYSKKEALGKILYEGVQEYTEENVNMIAQNEAVKKATDGNNYSYDFANTVKDVLSKEGFEQGIVGFIGGVMQTGATDLIKSFQKDSPSYDEDGNIKTNELGQPLMVTPSQSQREKYKAQQKSLKTIELLNKTEGIPTVQETLNKVKETSEILNDIQIAALQNNESVVKELKNTLLTNQSLDAFKNGTTEQLINMYKSLANDPEAKTKFGEDVHKTTTEAIKQIEDLEKVYQKHASLPQVTEVFNNRSEHYFNLKQGTQVETELNNAKLDQAKEMQITNSVTPEQIAKLASTDEVKAAEVKRKAIEDNVNKLNDEYRVLTSPEYTVKKAEAKVEEVKQKEQKVEQVFKEPKQPKTKPVENTQEEPYTGSTQDLESLLGGTPVDTAVQNVTSNNESSFEDKKADIERRRQEELNSSEKRYNITKEGNLTNNNKIRKFYVWESKDGSSTVAPDNIALNDEKALTEWHESKDHIKVWKEEKVQSDKEFEKSNKENEIEYNERNSKINAKYDAELAALKASKDTQDLSSLLGETPLPKQDGILSQMHSAVEDGTIDNVVNEDGETVRQVLTKSLEELNAGKIETVTNDKSNKHLDIVSESLITNTGDNTHGDEQIIVNPNEVQKGVLDNIKGVASMANVAMMRIFDHYFTKENQFRFERDKNGLPLINNQSLVDIKELNNVKAGDRVEFELVTLTGKALDDYNSSKEESIKHINHNVSNMGNSYNYATNDKQYGFDDKHIAIKSNGKIIGYVQQPHAITVVTNVVNPNDGTQLYTDARNDILAERKAILKELSEGKSFSTISKKGSGNLYTKLKEDGKIDLVNDLFTTKRDKDLTPSGNLVFVFNNGTSLELPKMNDEELEEDIKVRLSKLGNWGKSGSVYQLVKDSNDEWYPIPVYSNKMNDVTIKDIMDALKTVTNASDVSDVINALNPFIYATFDINKKNAPIVVERRGNITTLTIDGTEHQIDNLNKGIGAKEFKDSLISKRQNIETLNINSKFTQNSIKKRNTLASNALAFEGEYLVQPFVTYTPISKSSEVKNYTKANKQSEVTLNSNETEGETLLEQLIKKNGEIEDTGFSRTVNNGVPVDKVKFNQWLSKNLPGLTVSDISDLSALKTNITDALGAYRNMVMYLFNGATNKTAYHEAFHCVFRNMLTPEQRVDVIKDAINKYPTPTEENLKFLQEGMTKKATKEQLTYLYYEEQLADSFGEFVDSGIDAMEKSTFTKIKDFFNKIFNYFNIFAFNKQSNIDKLFDSINTGKFKNKSNIIKSNNIELINKELKSIQFEDLAFSRHSDFKATFKWDRTKSIGDNFMVKYQTLVSQGVENIKSEAIYKEIYNEYKSLQNNAEILNKLKPLELQNLSKLLNNFDFLRKEVDKYLEGYKISTNSKGEIDYNEAVVENIQEDAEVNTLESKETKGLSEQVTQAGLKSASVRVKMFLSGIEVVDKGVLQKDVYGFTKFHEFIPLYYYLERQLTGIDNFQEMISEMKVLSNLRPELLQVIDKLTKPSTFTDAKQLTKLQNDFKSNFSKQQLTYTLVKFDTDSSTGEVSYRLFDANRMSIANEISNQWSENLNNPNRRTIAEHISGVSNTKGTTGAREAAGEYGKIVEMILSGKGDMSIISNYLMNYGIEFSPEVLKDLISRKSDTLVLNLKDVVLYHISKDPDAKITENYDKAIKTLIKLETSAKLNSYTQSFNNVENSNIYTIQLPSFTSKLMSDLTGKYVKFNNRLEQLRKDPLYKYSNILSALETEQHFRTEQFKLSYLDGLKDEKGTSDGSKFTTMSPKDFMSMQLSLFQNFSQNNGKKGKTGKVGKYIYVTPSDKSMAMIFDGKIYNATLTNGKVNVETPIVNNFYNVFLQEASRIKQQLDIKAKVESGELKSDVLLEHYHYAPYKVNNKGEFIKDANGKKIKGNSTDFDGFAYQFMHFGEGFNVKFNKLVLDNINNSEDVQEAMSVIENEVKLEIVEQLKKDIDATLNEAVQKGVITQDKNTYKSISLDSNANKDVRQVIADFALNTWLNNIEMSNLLNGDVALYKAKDLQKRTYQSGAMGVSINTIDKPFAKTKVVKDFYSKSDLESLREFAGDVIDNYNDNNVTDAQVLVSPEFYKSVFEGRGTWDDKMQTAFDIAEGVITNPTAQQLKDARLQLSNIKPFYFGNRFDEKLGIQRFEQVKCAMLPLFKSYIKDNPLLAEKRSEMDSEKLDLIAFESSFKAAIGSRQSIDSKGGLTLDLDMKNFMVQVDNPAHILDEENDSIRQVKMLMLGNIDPNINYNGKSGKTIVDEINELEGYNIEESLKDLNKLINNDKEGNFKQYLKEMLTKRNATENMMEALNIVDGEFQYALDGGPTSVAMENLISSLFTNKVIKQAFEGGSGVQASSLGMRYKGGDTSLDKMQSDLQYFKNKDGIIEWAEAIMPAWSKEFFNEDGTHKSNIPDNLKELLFYRIPTEGFHSMMPIRVKSFLPVEYGNTILMPYEVTTQFGADFDFDKVYFLSPSFTKNDKGELEKVMYDNNKSIGDNGKNARNNKILDNYLHVLSSKEILPLMLNPSGFEELKNTKEKIDEKDNIQYKSGSFFSSVTQRDYKARNHVGRGLKGQLALHISGHSYATLLDLKLKAGNIMFNGQVVNNLSNLYDLTGKKLISREVSSLLAAILDDIKNPIIQALGINEFTADVWATIIRAGFDSKTGINMLTQPVIVELSKKLDENQYKIKSKDSKRNSGDTLFLDYQNRLNQTYEGLIEEQKIEVDSIMSDDNITDVDLEFYRHWKAINVNKLNPNDGRTQEDKDKHNLALSKYYQFQLKVLSNYNSIDKIAKDLVKINRLFGANKEVGPNVEDIVNKKYLLAEIEDEEFSIDGLNTETLKNIKPLQAAYNTQLSALEYLNKYFPYDSKRYKDIKYNVINKLFKVNGGDESLSKIPVKTRMLINGFTRNFIDASFDGFMSINSSSVKEELFTKVPTKLTEIQDATNDVKYFNGELRKNVFISNLKSVYDEKSGLSFITIRGNKLDTQLKNNMSESMYSLFSNASTKPFIVDLIKHSFAATGFHRGLRSYHDLIPPIILEELNYADYRKTATKALNLNLNIDINNDRLVDQLVRNFPSDLTKTFDMFTFKKKGKDLITSIEMVKMSGRTQELILNYDKLISGEQPVYVKYLRVYDSVAERSNIYKNTGGATFTPISKLGKAGHMIEINTLEDIENSLVKENNLDNKSILTTFVDETSTDEQIERPTYDSDEFLGEPSQDLGDLVSETEATTVPTNTETINIYAGTNENAELSNFATRPFTYKGQKFNSVEQAFQYAKGEFYNIYEIDPSSKNIPADLQKIVDAHLKNILNAKTGAQAKALGRKNIGIGFESDMWNDKSSAIMKDLIIESFKQNPDALVKLLDTGNATLTHTQDKGKWGTEFPKLLMEVRDELRNENKLPDNINTRKC